MIAYEIYKKGKINEKVFVAAKKRWDGQGYEVQNPTQYREESLEHIKYLLFYLIQIYGDKIKKQIQRRNTKKC